MIDPSGREEGTGEDFACEMYMRPIEKKNIALCIVFSIITCGIYSWYWLYCLAEDVNIAADRQDGPSGGFVLLFTIITCSIYQWYWLYKSGDLLEQGRASRGKPQGYLSILYLLLGLFGVGLIAFALMQSELNDYAAAE